MKDINVLELDQWQLDLLNKLLFLGKPIRLESKDTSKLIKKHYGIDVLLSGMKA